MKEKPAKKGRPPDPESKRSKGEDRHASPRFTLHLDEEFLEALEEFRASFPYKPHRSEVVREALYEFLKAKGFPPRRKNKEEK